MQTNIITRRVTFDRFLGFRQNSARDHLIIGNRGQPKLRLKEKPRDAAPGFLSLVRCVTR